MNEDWSRDNYTRIQLRRFDGDALLLMFLESRKAVMKHWLVK